MQQIQKKKLGISLKDYEIQIESKPVKIYLKRSFNTAHSSSTTRTNFFVKSSLQNTPYQTSTQNQSPHVGYGECGLPPKKPYCYLADIEDCQKFINKVVAELKCFNQQLNSQSLDINLFQTFFQMLYNQLFGDIFTNQNGKSPDNKLRFFKQKFKNLTGCQLSDHVIQQIYFYMQVFFLLIKAKQFSIINPEYKAARNALQFSLLDLVASIQEKSVSYLISGRQDYFQRSKNFSFYTISYEQNLQSMLQNGRDSLTYTDCIKIKFNNQIQNLIDLLILMDKNKVGQKWIIDANACWTPSDFLKFQQMLLKLCAQNLSVRKKIQFIQQPFPIFKSLVSTKSSQQILLQKQQWQKIKQNTSLIIIADESFASFQDLKDVMNYSHGINIKMEKCGGPIEAVRTLKEVQKFKIQHVMFGSMVSTHLGCTQTFQFYQYTKYFDIDGALLVRQPQIQGGFEWKGSQGILKVNGKRLSLDINDIQRVFQK